MRRAAFALVAVVLAAYGLLLGVAALRARGDLKTRPCPGSGTLILVDTAARVLCLCRDGRAEGRFHVALGSGGLDKRREGDRKTPLGRYALGNTRPSSRFHLFLPVGYPTPEQAREGYSGSDIGVHGPHAGFAWLWHASTWADWTQGCVAVATTRDVERIAKWVVEAGAEAILFV